MVPWEQRLPFHWHITQCRAQRAPSNHVLTGHINRWGLATLGFYRQWHCWTVFYREQKANEQPFLNVLRFLQGEFGGCVEQGDFTPEIPQMLPWRTHLPTDAVEALPWILQQMSLGHCEAETLEVLTVFLHLTISNSKSCPSASLGCRRHTASSWAHKEEGPRQGISQHRDQVSRHLVSVSVQQSDI